MLLLVIVLVLLTGERSERCSSNVGAGRRRHRGPIHAVEGRRVRWVNVHAKYVDWGKERRRVTNLIDLRGTLGLRLASLSQKGKGAVAALFGV